jgi:hypothetical protein
VRTGNLAFFGRCRGRPLTDVTLKNHLRRLRHGDVTVHGFGAPSATGALTTGRPSDVAEPALAHVTGGAVARAYARSDLLVQRWLLMEQWAAFLTRPAAEGIRLAV